MRPHLRDTTVDRLSPSGRAAVCSLPFLTALLLFLVMPMPSALAASPICSIGSGAGQCLNPRNIAVDPTAQRLYVADAANNRLDVFSTKPGPSYGSFVKTFGFGVQTGSSAFQECASGCRAGIAGSAAGQFAKPFGIAVDNDPGSPSFHDIYVGELGLEFEHPRIQKLNPLAGPGEEHVEFLLMLGGGVDKTVPGNVCTAASGHTCGAGRSGGGEGEFFSTTLALGVYVGVGPGGTVYAVDSLENETKARLQRFAATGAVMSPQHILFESISTAGSFASGLTVDSAGNFWVTGSASGTAVLDKFEADGTLLKSILTGVAGATGIGLDPADDHVFIGIGAGSLASVIEFNAGGSVLRRFGYGSLERISSGLAIIPGKEAIVASESFGEGNPGDVLEIPFAPPGPVVFPEPCSVAAGTLSSVSATLASEINPEGEETKYHYQLVDDPHFQSEGFANATRVPAQASGDPALDGKPGQPFPLFELENANVGVANLIPETKYHCRVVAENGAGTATGQAGEFIARPAPEFGALWTSDVGTEAATLHAEVDPVGVPGTTGFFEYVSDAVFQSEGGFAHAQRAPLGEEIDFGAGNGFKTGTARPAGLQPGTLYHYRISGTNSAISPLTKSSPERSFRTYRVPGSFALPDGRAWELVSPAQKGNAEVGTPGKAAGLFSEEPPFPRIRAAARSGDAITYTSWTSFGKAQGAPGASQYLSRRGAGGWSTENISPPGFTKFALAPPYRGFTPDLAFSSLVIDEPVLAPGGQEGVQNIYLRNDETGAMRALTTETPAFTSSGNLLRFCSVFAGASADGSRAFYAADGAMAGAPAGIGMSLYEYSPAGLQLVSVLPDGTPASPSEATAYGAGGGLCAIGRSIVAGAVASDGSIAFWTYGGKYKGSSRPLLARVDGAETQQLDAKAAGGSGSGEGKFWAATPDGSKAFFSDSQKLFAGAGTGDLYRYEPRKPEGERLTDLTAGAVPAEVKGVLGINSDGSYAYFVAGGVLTGEEEGAGHEKAQNGANNLYVYHEGEAPEVRFIARLSNEDGRAWSTQPEVRDAARVAGNGDLAFRSIETQALSSYDNHILVGEHCKPNIEGEFTNDPHCAEVYFYDASTRELTCASCDPSGARPVGPALLPVFTNPIEGPRFISEDGSRLYFESPDVLSADDENGRQDVYEFERLGTGACTAQASDFNPASGGCLSLISSGRSTDDSFLIDASADGRDVFFGTRQQLVGWDTNANYDVYDAREGGGFPEPLAPEPICEGESSCKPAATVPPAPGSSPSTQSFHGPGNPVKKKHKHKKGHDKHKKEKKKGRAGKTGRAAR